MLPWIRDGDVVIVSPADEAAVGDVICYSTSPDRLFLHRVVRCQAYGFVTKGDALSYTEIVARERVLGRVVAIERRGKIRRIDTRWARRGGRAAAWASPWVSRIIPVALGFRRMVRSALRD